MELTVESIHASQAKAASAFQERENDKRQSRHRHSDQRSGQGSKHPMRDNKINTNKPEKDEPKYDPSNPWNT